MSKYRHLLKKWWLCVIFLLIILSLFNGIWVLLFFATLATLTFAVIKVIKNENRRKYTLIIIVTTVLLLTFSLVRTVQLYNYIVENPEENVTTDDPKKDIKEDAETNEVEETEEMDQADASTAYTVTQEGIESFNESINRLISESNGILIKVVPFENEYDMLIAYVSQDLKYQDEATKQKNVDYLGSEIQQRALGTLFGGDNNLRPMVEFRYKDETKMAGSSAFDKTNMKLKGK
ncbi:MULTISPECIES: hypothetical protein [Listeria]|uniref:hypothetical protein n=1 Tax=Listeria TaxID=1637 RepID=UPI000BDFF46B|nr:MULTISPECIES: hypothetical protein [Listeria]EAC9112180.1 hypothetical protein [Listeria monocytogenes]EAD2123806.1 hypothetical protein [Listeria monocytogenes]EAF6520829.1 hypothetical protein [Listeria monocytogenes]EAG3479764.1 hypothetical protein [Listeria monocytogenes]ECH4663229.1 hypothetical protein [Listeria monocytogenes]